MQDPIPILGSVRRSCWAAVVAVLAGCQSYRPQPLDTGGHLVAWRSRDPASGPVRAFSERLSRTGGRPAVFDAHDGLTLEEAEAVALVYNADLRVRRASSSVAQAIARHAGRWSDPVLGFDGERIIESVANPWVLGATVGLTIPATGRTRAQVRKASADYQAELARVAAEEWRVRVRLRTTWVRWAADRARDESLRGFISELQPVLTAARSLAEAGEINRLEARLIETLEVSRSIELASLGARIRDSEALAKEVMGLRPDAQITLVSSLDYSARIAEDIERDAIMRSPSLEVRRQEYEVAERALRLEVEKQFPDLLVSPGFKEDEGTSRGLLSFALPIPAWNRNRAGIAEACARRDLARTEYEAELERVLAAVERARSRLEAAIEVRSRVERALIPLADAQRADVARLIELRQFEALAVLPALQNELEIKTRLIDARLEEALAAIDLQSLIGPPIADAGDQTTESHPTESRP